MKPLRIARRAAPIRILEAAMRSWLHDRAPSMGAAIAHYTIFSLAPMLWLDHRDRGSGSSQILLFGAELTKAIADWRRRRSRRVCN